MAFKILPSKQTTDRANAFLTRQYDGKYAALTREERGYASADDFKAYLNVPLEAKWPEHGIEPVMVPLRDGRHVPMWLRPQQPKIGRDGKRIKISTHRCYVECPNCRAEVPAGRTTQHKCKG
jgi:hypothetical protein